MGRSTLNKLALVCLVSSTVPAASALVTAVNAAQAVGLLPRDTSLQACGKGLPSAFSCPSDTACLPLNNTNTVSIICCPKGQACLLIEPVNCDIKLQDAVAHPGSALQTTNLTASLPTCGNSCCPFGYKCQNGNSCAILDSTAAAPTSASSSASTPSSTSKPSATLLPQTSTTTPSFPARAILAGFFPGLLLGLLLTLLVLFLLRRRRAAKLAKRDTIDFGPVDRTISDPIYHPQLSQRTEFLYPHNQEHFAPPPPPLNYTSPPTLPAIAFSPGEATLAGSSVYQPTTDKGKGKARAVDAAAQFQTPTRAPRQPKPARISTATMTTVPSPVPRVRSLFHKATPPPPRRGDSRSTRASRSRNPRDTLTRSGSQETIDVLMPGAGMEVQHVQQQMQQQQQQGRRDPFQAYRSERMTTFSGLMEDAGYKREGRR